MSGLFLDTFGLGEMFGGDQPFAGLATELYRACKLRHEKILTTNYIISEFVTLSVRNVRIPRQKMISIVERLIASEHVNFVYVDSRIHDSAWSHLVKHKDKNWSLVDCASFVLMKEHGITDALTLDHHFEQAGFNVLLK